MLRFKVNPMQLLKDAGFSSTKLRNEKVFGSATMQKMRNREMVSAHELDVLCGLLHAQPGDLIEWTQAEADSLE